MLDSALREAAQVMAWELESSRLRVGLAPSQIGHCWRRRIRVVEESNPEWYRRFCAEHSDSLRTRPRKRQKPDTYIKRAHTLRALREIASGQARTIYAERLLPHVMKECQRYEQENPTRETHRPELAPSFDEGTHRGGIGPAGMVEIGTVWGANLEIPPAG